MSDAQPRSIEVSVEVPGTPEAVWHAIATGPGISSWFMPMRVEEREGGRVETGDEPAEASLVTAWEPPTRLVFEGPEGSPHPLAYEWLVEARSGGTCIVRLVNSGFGQGSEWDGDYDAMTRGWEMFLEHLRIHLTHFAGRTAEPVVPSGFASGPNEAAWKALCDALGVADDLQPGDAFVTGEHAPPLRGTVATVVPIGYLLVLEAPLPGTALVVAEGDEQVMLSAWLYLYGDATRADDIRAIWTSWMTERFPAPAPG